MNNSNPFIPHGSFLEQKNKARARLRIAVLFSISLSVMALMALLIQGCRKNDAQQEEAANSNPPPELTNPTDTNSPATPPPAAPAPESNPPAPVPPPAPAPVAPPPPPAPVAPPVATQDYTVVKGDILATIAKKNNVTVKALEEANPGVDPKKLQIGQKLHIPAASAPMTAAPAPGAEEAAPSGGEQTYKVKSGDTLIGIAKQFHTKVKAIQSANNLSTTSIKVGQVLKIPAGAAPAPAPAPAPEAPPAPPAPPASLPPATPTNH